MTAKRETRSTVAMVVPSFDDVGGVGAVADFLLRVLSARTDLAIRIVSLATWARDPASQLILDPRTWARGPVTLAKTARGRAYLHVGAALGEIEILRLAPRPLLARALAECDLIQVVAGVPAWATPVLGLGKPVLVQAATLTAVERRARDGASLGPGGAWRRAMTQAMDRLDERALRAVDVVQVENPWMQAHAAARGARVVQAPPGVDTTLYRPAPADQLRADPPHVLAVGRFSDPRKNPMMLLEAYGAFAAGRPDAPKLVLAGATPPPPGFWSRARAEGLSTHIRFVEAPSVEALIALYQEASCLLLSSDEEGFGMVMIEAMACGAPVIATRCGGPEGVISDGEDGFLVDRGDAAAMAARLAQLHANPDLTSSMRRAALAKVGARYSDAAAGRAYLDLYDELLDRGR
jgi:D-inositol-3-phosphate glycosyltransferase